MKKIIVAMLFVSVCGCVTYPTYPQYVPKPKRSDFYGIKMNSVNNIDGLKIKSYSPEEGVSYSYNTSTMDSKISAFVDVSLINYGTNLKIQVSNKSNYPIQTNFFSDIFSIVTNDGKVYKLDNRSEMGREVINPDDTLNFRAFLERIEIKKADIKLITCELGITRRTLIVFKRLP